MKLCKLFIFRNMLRVAAAAGGIYICLRYAAECSEGIKKGILFCIEALVPSLFMFMALSSYIVKSGIAQAAVKPLGKLSHSLFRLPSPTLAVLILSIIGGYPVGAGCAAMMFGQGELSKEQAKKTACIAVCAGPGFLINFVGAALLNNTSAGVMLLCAEIIGVLLTGIVIGRIMPVSTEAIHRKNNVHNRENLLIASVSDASRATFNMCGMVVICSAVIEVISSISDNSELTDIAAALIEITTGCHRLCGSYPLYIIAFFIGFGGISVHLQIYAGARELDIKKESFFIFRIIQGIITSLAAYILLMVFPMTQRVFNSTDLPLNASGSATLVGSAALVLSSLCFIGNVHHNTKQIRR